MNEAFDEYWRVTTQQWRRHELSLINECFIYFQLRLFCSKLLNEDTCTVSLRSGFLIAILEHEA